MTPERAHAYRRVIRTLNELGPSKLQGAEQDLIRSAADSLIFCHDLLADEAACEALAEVERLCHALVDSGRWANSSAMSLAEDVAQCGPVCMVELKAA
jgi:hypothetical protein